jgi:hypothetical protein
VSACDYALLGREVNSSRVLIKSFPDIVIVLVLISYVNHYCYRAKSSFTGLGTSILASVVGSLHFGEILFIY